MEDTAFGSSVRKVWGIDLVGLTVILPPPFNVDIGDIVGWKIKDIPDEWLRLRPRRIG